MATVFIEQSILASSLLASGLPFSNRIYRVVTLFCMEPPFRLYRVVTSQLFHDQAFKSSVSQPWELQQS